MAKYGWIPDRPDQRDMKMALAPRVLTASLPPHVDFRVYGPAIYDQGDLGSCTANAIAGALQFDQIKQGEKSFQPSRLFIYYNERSMEGTIGSDAGAMIRDGIKSVNAIGACPEYMWPYDVAKFAQRPLARCYQNAKLGQSVRYQAVAQSIDQFRAVLATKTPIVFGFTVYESFESADVSRTGEVPMPGPHEYTLGGHAVEAYGYDDATRRFICRNSWGTNWGDKGYFTIPYEYLTDPNLADDFWVINQVK
jgi:C1A family cysteine protease